MKKFKKRNNKKFQNHPPKIGDKVVTETVVVYSNATVVWQDGTIETGIASRQLYPIHHLDEHVNKKKIEEIKIYIYTFFYRNFSLVILF